MAVPRKFIVDESCSSTYHCVSRTVRQAFLLAPDREGAGPDDASGGVDNHRRDWILERVRMQAQIFAVDCISLAVMSNHLHLLLRILPELVESWSALEVAYRWLLLRPERARREAMGVDLSLPPLESEVAVVAGDAECIATLRGRLASPSWYMKELKEWIARRVNREESRTGAFWEERFRSYRVLDLEGLLRCAVYIDLNPVAACMVEDPLLARYTSVGEHARSRLGPDDVRRRAKAATGTSVESPREVQPAAPDGARPASSDEPATMASRCAARELWRRVLEAPHARGRHGAEPWREGMGEKEFAEGMADFVTSFDGMSFHAAAPARREPHHPRGMAEDGESIVVIPVLERIPQQIGHVVSGQVDVEASEDRATQPDARSTESIQSDAIQLDAARRDPRHQDAGTDEATATSKPAATTRSKAAAALASIPPRQARHRRQPPDVAVLDTPLGEYLVQLRMLAELAQEQGLTKRQGKRQAVARRRSREEIELALGRQADDRGLAALLSALFGSTDSLPGERGRLLAELLSGSRLFGTAVGSKAALAAEALRRGRTRVVMAFRSESGSRRTKRKPGPGRAKGSPATPRAG